MSDVPILSSDPRLIKWVQKRVEENMKYHRVTTLHKGDVYQLTITVNINAGVIDGLPRGRKQKPQTVTMARQIMVKK